ncbi:class A beta-lactamase [Mycolicibacterium celeriflavum]|uniref:Beta-lactamase n=1 Tax=Mycolicibacterium celeriflavum TaxID=1249101 RepID=A0A1X0C3A2_MYCCF|nr:class A beta-lactamase [Mycolicibacterium celeriflavum]MCV7239432.1 class A beta-lactamase [Mycolicibacterium celeriflavum]OBG13197.1 class A beta-lactamase [Mycolicibacterium celeriflavum]ORA51718.1 class A beta-lactamase [Mycolicibacterium celeriflavum]BBY43123.1 beta-lactamase [Mycolicibacterium celeriflavum]
MTRLSRRHVLIGGLTLAALAACTERQAAADPRSVPPIDARIGEFERQHNALIGVFAVNLDTGQTIRHRAQEPFAMCSTFKGYAAARILQKAERDELALSDRVTIDQTDIVPNSPVTQTRVGQTMSLAELCEAALQRSDNAAGNLLLRAIGGPPAITDFARSIGDQRSRLDRWEVELNAAVPGDPRDTTTPEAIGGGYRSMLTGAVLAEPQRRQLEDWMRANQTSSVRPALPPGWTTADKTGSGDYASTNDVGVAYGPDGRRLLLALMTRSAGNDPNAPNMRPLIGELAALLVAALLA